MKWRAVGFVSVVLVVSVLLAYVNHDHRTRVSSRSPDDVRFVLVATQPIPKGAPGVFIFSQSMYGLKPFPPKDVEDGAISDPIYLNGRVSVVDISPGQQLTETDFTGSDLGGG